MWFSLALEYEQAANSKHLALPFVYSAARKAPFLNGCAPAVVAYRALPLLPLGH
jgi:hypothetical protein